jgi:hypothetical protein
VLKASSVKDKAMYLMRWEITVPSFTEEGNTLEKGQAVEPVSFDSLLIVYF